jgi:hypothetical protein
MEEVTKFLRSMDNDLTKVKKGIFPTLPWDPLPMLGTIMFVTSLHSKDILMGFKEKVEWKNNIPHRLIKY